MEFTAKKVEEAIELGLKELGLDLSQAEIKVISEPTKGLFGRLKGNAVVDITKKCDQEQNKKQEQENSNAKKVKKEQIDNTDATIEFVLEILSKLSIDAEIEKSIQDGNTVLTIKTNDSSMLIGYRGEVLTAIQTLAGACQNIGVKDYQKVVVDCENYRQKREETLVNLAHKLEGKATSMRREVILEPMSPYERRIIHTALANSETVTTKSDGKEPNRYVVIVPNDLDEYSRPYNAGRNNDKDKKNNKRNSQPAIRKGLNKRISPSKPIRKAPSVFGTYLGNSLKDE